MTDPDPIKTIHGIAAKIEASERDAATIADLRREIERLRTELKDLGEDYRKVHKWHDEDHEAVAELKAELEAARATIFAWAKSWHTHGDFATEETTNACPRCQAEELMRQKAKELDK